MKRLANMVGLAALGAAVTMPASAAFAQDFCTVEISAVLATKDKRSFDPRLNWMRRQLQSLPFKSYELVASRSCDVRSSDQCSMRVPGDGFLHLTTTESSPQQLRVRLILNRGNRPIVNADLRLDRNAGILMRSMRTESGTLLISVRATAGPPVAPSATAGK